MRPTLGRLLVVHPSNLEVALEIFLKNVMLEGLS